MSSPHVRPPSVDALLRSNEIQALIKGHGRLAVTKHIRIELDARRDAPAAPDKYDIATICSALEQCLQTEATPSLRPVFNLTGTVIHTNLGRAPMAAVAADAMHIAASEPANLEFDLERGRRGQRDTHVEQLICELTGAEAATVVNNNAAAVLLVLQALARRKEVIVSRGELIEIGGSFRMPDIMKSAGCKLREVGTTNRTHAHDFENAINAKTAMIMKVHMANYSIDGFTSEVAEKKLAAISRAHDLPFVIDLGSGTLINFENHGLPHEPTPQEAIANGADLVTFSGDKLLGGPQAGIICGRKDLVARLNKHPMKRALRLDKVTLAGLSATLKLYRNPDQLVEELPVLRLLLRSANDIREQAARLLPAFSEVLADTADVAIENALSQVGSGSLPIDRLPSVVIAITPSGPRKRHGKIVERLASQFRALPRPMIGRVSDGRLFFDLRCLAPEDEALVIEQIGALQPHPDHQK